MAWEPLGFTALAYSEIEPFARAVLTHHYAHVPLHGDFTVLRDKGWIAGADVLVGGTPCQAFSVAGLRRSLDDCPDGPRYRALGNSMAVNVMRWIGARIKAEVGADREEFSE